MIRRLLLGGFAGFAFLALLAPQASAQIIFPNVPKIQFPKIEGLPIEVQKQLEELQRQLEQGMDPAVLQELNRGLEQGTGTTMKWGGLRLKKVTATLQEQLGLPENEGMIITAVDANSTADSAGLKVNDVLVKINDKAVPNDFSKFMTLVKEQKGNEAMNLVVIRKGKEETIKAVRMPTVASANPNLGGGGAGGIRRPGIGGLGGLIIPRIQINPKGGLPNINPVPPQPQPQPQPFPAANIRNLNMEMTINGVKISRKQTTDQFSGSYTKNDLKITVSGKIENGRSTVSEITVQDGNDTKKYNNLAQVPAQHRTIIQQMLLPSSNMIPNIPSPKLDDA